jgi:N-acetylmuramoyl-L-alanine amidase
MKKWMQLGLCFLFFAGAFWFSKEALLLVQSEKDEITIAIDPGHGGFDGGFTPGEINGRAWTEKEINLSISLLLKERLLAAGYQVVMTREADVALYKEGDASKKKADMQNRVAAINESGATLAVSIHQNSFTEESSHGAQTFYHPSSTEAEQLAKTIQTEIKKVVADDNHRTEKSNDSYYMLKKSTCPLVIVECGFLSNPTEAQLLITEEYQEKIAEGIFQGILAYLTAR